MRKSGYIILTIFFISIFLLIRWFISSEGNKKAPPTSKYSLSIDDSKKNGVFEFEVATEKSNWVLDSGFKIGIKEAWVENAWYTQNYVIGGSKMEKMDSTHELILQLNIDSSNRTGIRYFYFIGSRHLNTFVHFYCHRIDTIKIPLYREISDDLPSKKDRQAFDTLTFVKR